MKILITGASGFIGSFIVEEALKRGFETWAAVRGSSKRDFLQDDRIHFIELSLNSQEKLEAQRAAAPNLVVMSQATNDVRNIGNTEMDIGVNSPGNNIAKMINLGENHEN